MASPEFILLLSLGLAILAALGFRVLFARLKQPVVLGQLIAGMLIGPFGLGLIQDVNTINLLASLGIVLLLFTVGLGLDPLEIRRIGAGSLVLTITELTVSFLSVLAVCVLVGLTYLESIFVAVTVSTTSTAIMGKLLLESKSLKYKDSHLVLTASVIEDFVIVFVLLLLPGLVVANSQVPLDGLEVLAAKGVLLIAVIFFFGWKIAPKVIDRFVMGDEKHQETAFLLALSFGFIFALLSSFLGFSPAVGAFLVGLMIRDKQAEFITEKIGPIKDLFVVLFFVAMGTLINIAALLTITLPIMAVITIAVLGKFFGSWLGARLSQARNAAVKVGVSMLPRGEFSFIVASEGTGLGVASQILYPIAGLTTLVSSIAASLGLRLLRPHPARKPVLPIPIIEMNIGDMES